MRIGDFGQPRLEEQFEAMLEAGRVAGSFLFEGPAGTGKEAFAVELGRVVNCDNQPVCAPKPLFARAAVHNTKPTKASSKSIELPRCNSCHKFDLLQHPDLLLVFPVPTDTWDEAMPQARGENRSLNTVGEILRDKARDPYFRPSRFDRPTSIQAEVLREHVLPTVGSRPVEARIKTIILTDAESITRDMGNVLLKTLEEPPENCLLILTSSVPERLLPTIRSRCQRLRFAPLAPEWMEPRLQMLHEVTPTKAKLAAAISQGSMLSAARFLQGDLDLIREHAFNILDAAARGAELDLLEIAQGLAQEHTKKRTLVPLTLQMIAVGARDAAVLTVNTSQALVNSDKRAAVEKFARAFPPSALHAVVRRVEAAERQIAGNAAVEHALATAFLALAELGAEARSR